jgi:holliday junction DNA helicase RuvA
MISYLKGTILFKDKKSITLDVSGIGYRIFVREFLLEHAQKEEQKEFFTFLYVREDILDLYGFETLEEKDFFELLISISGVGPKSALQTLSIAKVKEIKQAILRGDPTLLKKVSGIGNKTAERIVLELKNKIDELPLGDGETIDLSIGAGQGLGGAFEALRSLGYSEVEIRESFKDLPTDMESEDDMIRFSLKNLGKSK